METFEYDANGEYKPRPFNRKVKSVRLGERDRYLLSEIAKRYCTTETAVFKQAIRNEAQRLGIK